MGYFGIGIENPKRECNIGTLWRSAYAFGAAFIFTIGGRYRNQSSDTTKSWRHIPLIRFETLEQFLTTLPYSCQLVGVEYGIGACELAKYEHAERVIYLLGAEDGGLSKDAMNACKALVSIPSRYCLNVATAGSIVMYDRAVRMK
ncbi:RNA methyltransferase [Nitrospira sp. BLG_1]|uniref:RNA methyltransferase n=1 Tax=Nitrospira sp. BLG_1 TaxID=3395883 RepID=UPI0039BC5883